MPKLNQIVAIEKGVKNQQNQVITEAYHTIKKPAQFTGIARTYRPKDEDGDKLKCARCLAPGVDVDEDGKSTEDGMRSDQVSGWLPAVPSLDTYWGYSSVPPEGVEWWKALPTYAAPVATFAVSQ